MLFTQLQRRAARFVTNRYHNKSSVNDMLGNLKWHTLEERRTNARLTMLYKIKKPKEVNIEADHKLIPTNRKLRNTNSNCFQLPSCNTTTRKLRNTNSNCFQLPSCNTTTRKESREQSGIGTPYPTQ
jgi:hypothetical protein